MILPMNNTNQRKLGLKNSPLTALDTKKKCRGNLDQKAQEPRIKKTLAKMTTYMMKSKII